MGIPPSCCTCEQDIMPPTQGASSRGIRGVEMLIDLCRLVAGYIQMRIPLTSLTQAVLYRALIIKTQIRIDIAFLTRVVTLIYSTSTIQRTWQIGYSMRSYQVFLASVLVNFLFQGNSVALKDGLLINLVSQLLSILLYPYMAFRTIIC